MAHAQLETEEGDHPQAHGKSRRDPRVQLPMLAEQGVEQAEEQGVTQRPQEEKASVAGAQVLERMPGKEAFDQKEVLLIVPEQSSGPKGQSHRGDDRQQANGRQDPLPGWGGFRRGRGANLNGHGVIVPRPTPEVPRTS